MSKSSSERYTCNLKPETLKKAIAELNEPEDNDKRLQAIDALRTRFEEENNGLELIRSDDAFLLRFLRVMKFDQERAYQRLLHYHEQRKSWPEVFERVNQPAMMSDFLDAGAFLSIGQKAIDKTFVVIGRPGLGFKESSDVFNFVASVILTMEKLLEDEDFQVYGVTVIEDMSNFGLTFAMQFASLGKKFVSMVQDAMPIRLKSLNMANEALVFDILYAVVSKFMKEKTKNRLDLIGTDFKKLHKKIPQESLPPSLGGTGSDLNDLAQAWKRELISTMGEGEDTSL